MSEKDLGLAMLELKIALDKFAEAFTSAVVRDLKCQVEILAAAYPPMAPPVVVANDLLKGPCGIDMSHSAHDECPGKTTADRPDSLERVCPRAVDHEPHTWSFPKSTHTHRCPGRKGVEQMCDISYQHDAHDWYPNLYERRLCPGGPGSRQCPDNLAHHEHTWHHDLTTGQRASAGTPGARPQWCHGLETDLEVQWCGDRPEHEPHTWGQTEGARVAAFCKGVREVRVSLCSSGKAHKAHNWQDAQDKAVACPGVKVFGDIPAAGPAS